MVVMLSFALVRDQRISRCIAEVVVYVEAFAWTARSLGKFPTTGHCRCKRGDLRGLFI